MFYTFFALPGKELQYFRLGGKNKITKPTGPSQLPVSGSFLLSTREAFTANLT
jgi:hypothetical protein